jgi:hypothetical protein
MRRIGTDYLYHLLFESLRPTPRNPTQP